MEAIKQFEDLLEPHLDGLKVTSYTIKRLVPPGENFGSIIAAVDVLLSDGNELHLVAKMIMENELTQKIYNIEVAFKKEVNFYRNVVPSLVSFQRSCSVDPLDVYHKYYGGRFSLKGDFSDFDDDACLLVENSKPQGFQVTDRIRGFDTPMTKHLLKLLAHFHAVPIALKIKEPSNFEELKSNLGLNYADREALTLFANNISKATFKFITDDPELAIYADRIRAVFDQQVDNYICMRYVGREPFNTIVHNDMWATNILIKYDENGNPIGTRLVDFQQAVYGNPGHDLILIIHCGCEPASVLEHFDELIDFYFEEFLSKLKEFNLDTKPFTREFLEEELKDAARSQLFHAMFLLTAVFSERKEENAIANEKLFTSDMSKHVTPEYLPHLKALILNFVRHKWI